MIRIQKEDFSTEQIVEGMKDPEIGAIVVYVGTVRSFSEDREIESLEFEVDEGTAEVKLEELEQRARHKFDIKELVIVHRLGGLKVSDKILMIAASASHREPAFAACNYIIDDIKNLHAGWKRETNKFS